MEFNKYQEEAMKNKVYGYGDKIIYPALGLGESGEVQGKVKKVLRDGNGDFENYCFKIRDKNGIEQDVPAKEAIAEELSDILWYCAAMAEDLGYSLNDIAQINLNKCFDRRSRGVIQGSGDNR